MELRLQKRILEAELLPTEKLVGMVIAYHIHPKYGYWRIGQAAIARECGVSIPTVKRAVTALCRAGYIEVRRTGRTAKYFSLVKSHINYDSSPMSYQTDHPRSIRGTKSGNPWDLDTTFSTRAEEEYKRLLKEKDNG